MALQSVKPSLDPDIVSEGEARGANKRKSEAWPAAAALPTLQPEKLRRK
jgi:hypothetical protein